MIIVDDPAIVEVTATDSNASEVNSEPGVFTVTRTGGDFASELKLTLRFSGAAKSGRDYPAQTARSIPANAISATYTITPIADNLTEGDETVILTVIPSSRHATGSSESATVIIADTPL